MRERIEQIAREAVERTHKGIYVNPEVFQIEVAMCHSAIIAILTDPAVGFKEALVRGNAVAKAGAGLFHEIDELMGDTDPIEDDDATIACQKWWEALHGFDSINAAQKLKELESL